jgi:alpha-L-rhamnosidase
MDVPEPRFSWQLSDPAYVRGQTQTAYHILMASRPGLLTEAAADVWNSGKTDSQQSVLVPYGGKKLPSSSPCFWKVRVYDRYGKPSEWSETTQFITGVLDAAEWDAAKWIRHPDAPRTEHIWFRSSPLHLDVPAANVVIHVASMGHHELYVNGRKADNRVLAPALTNFDKRLFYVTYDITRLLSEGDNTIGIWFGAGWANYDCFSRTPALRVLLAGCDDNGRRLALASDESWRCAVSNSCDTREVLTYNDNGGEIIDARRAFPEWNLPAFDDSRWAFAATADGNDGVELSAHDVAPSVIIDTLAVKKITDTGDGTYKIDFGKNFTGWIKVAFHGLEAGDTVVIGSADDSVSFDDFNIRNYFVSSGADGETFSNRFNYVAGRYLNLKGLRRAPEPDDATAYPVGTNLVRAGGFTSSNTLFNEIFDMDLWTFAANTTEGYTSDCPHRERCGYGEEATATSWGIGLPNYHGAEAFYRHTVRNWRDVQTADGWGRHTAPQPNDYHWGGAIWCSAGMNVAWEHYLHSGDLQILRLIYPTARRWLEFLHAHTAADGLLTRYRPHPGQFLGDWIAPGSRSEFGDSPQALYFNNCVYAMNLETFVEMARLLGRPDDAALYAGRLAGLRPAVHARFYNPSTARYSDGTQVQQAFALLTGIVPDSERGRVEALIADDMNGAHPYFDMGSSGIFVLLRYLCDHPELAGTAAKILSRTDYPGYGYFISRGETTWPEDWKADVPSKIHTCYTGIAGWFTKGLCGIQPDRNSPGYRHFTVRPAAPVAGVDRAEATVCSPYGKITAGRECTGDRFALSVTVPPGTSATVYIPEAYAGNITESGLALEDAGGITVKGTADGYFVIDVEAGRYLFASASNP